MAAQLAGAANSNAITEMPGTIMSATDRAGEEVCAIHAYHACMTGQHPDVLNSVFQQHAEPYLHERDKKSDVTCSGNLS